MLFQMFNQNVWMIDYVIVQCRVQGVDFGALLMHFVSSSCYKKSVSEIVLDQGMAGIVSEELRAGKSLEGSFSRHRCQSGEALAEWQSSEQVDNGIPYTSPPYWDTDEDDDGGEFAIVRILFSISCGLKSNLLFSLHRAKTIWVAWEIYLENRKVFSDYQKGTS